MSTIGVVSSDWRNARTISSVAFKVWPALSARCDDIWMAGPSAMGSVNGMPSSTTSAPALGNAVRIASEVAGSGSPAVRNVTSAARPSTFSAAKRRSMRVLMSRETCVETCLDRGSIGQSAAPALACRREAHVDRAQHQRDDRTDELHPFLLLQGRAGLENALPQEVGDVAGRHDHQ